MDAETAYMCFKMITGALVVIAMCMAALVIYAELIYTELREQRKAREKNKPWRLT